MNLFIAIVASYLLGAIPFAFILGKLLKKIDLRTIGSGNIGATNLARVAGFKIGLIALLLDMAKGLIPVVFFAQSVHQNLPFSHDALRCLLGLVSICGHNWTVFLKFKGGKGIATSLGVLIGLALMNGTFATISIILVLVWAIIFLSTGFVSLSSILAAFILPILLVVFRQSNDFVCFGVALSIFAIIRHKSNISRLLENKENRFPVAAKIKSFLKKPLSKKHS